jgi:alkylhydroperoxidase family enzyme
MQKSETAKSAKEMVRESIGVDDSQMQAEQMDAFLPPIENPQDPTIRHLYEMTQQQWGKVLMPVKVFNARMPAEFAQFIGMITQLHQKLTLPNETVMLISQKVANINICSFCIDIGRAVTIKTSMNQAKFDALEEYESSPLFTDAERAALDYATELTTNKTVNPETFARLTKYYSEREICEIVWLVASEHLYNMTNIGLNIHSDMLCDITKKNKSL